MAMCNFWVCLVAFIQLVNFVVGHAPLFFQYHFEVNGNMQFFGVICVGLSCCNHLVNFALGHLSLYFCCHFEVIDNVQFFGVVCVGFPCCNHLINFVLGPMSLCFYCHFEATDNVQLFGVVCVGFLCCNNLINQFCFGSYIFVVLLLFSSNNYVHFFELDFRFQCYKILVNYQANK